MKKLLRFSYAVLAVSAVTLAAVLGHFTAELPEKLSYTDDPYGELGTHYIKITPIETYRQTLSAAPSRQTARLSLFGMFGIKDIQIERTDRPNLIPCGTPFGIKMLTIGVVVTDFGYIGGSSPAKDAGIKAGDNILRINGVKITDNDDIADAVALAPKSAEVELIRDGSPMTLSVTPTKSIESGEYKIGVWVRDSTAGIGTVTYYDKATGVFAGLGHGVCDGDTGKLMPLSEGHAVPVSINRVVKGKKGAPGELCGSFLSEVAIGTIAFNTDSGVFGKMENPPAITGEIPMAFKQEVKTGAAEILSTVGGSEAKAYSVIIEKINYDETNAVKNMIVRVTDPELLNTTGGIAQGMSGSPIIQNGRLAGAVTHVFVGDVTRGYAIFAENMYDKSLQIEVSRQDVSKAA
ncbi:MAG: SpoIVB peptidase [Oscillospiraceae bacterium]|jgi:stage IV sporulation protein B|nr:SpoIVB peptidase [Oscillospiraceae bacterium]